MQRASASTLFQVAGGRSESHSLAPSPCPFCPFLAPHSLPLFLPQACRLASTRPPGTPWQPGRGNRRGQGFRARRGEQRNAGKGTGWKAPWPRPDGHIRKMERAKGFRTSTSTLASYALRWTESDWSGLIVKDVAAQALSGFLLDHLVSRETNSIREYRASLERWSRRDMWGRPCSRNAAEGGKSVCSGPSFRRTVAGAPAPGAVPSSVSPAARNLHCTWSSGSHRNARSVQGGGKGTGRLEIRRPRKISFPGCGAAELAPHTHTETCAFASQPWIQRTPPAPNSPRWDTLRKSRGQPATLPASDLLDLFDALPVDLNQSKISRFVAQFGGHSATVIPRWRSSPRTTES